LPCLFLIDTNNSAPFRCRNEFIPVLRSSDSTVKQNQRMKSYRMLIGLILLAAALVLIKIFLFPNTTPGNSGNARRPYVPAVNALVVKPQPVMKKVMVSGTLLANETVNLQPQVSGMITRLHFKEGDRVTKGALLVKINDAPQQALLQKQQASLEVAKNNLERVEKLYRLSSVSLDDYNNAVLSVKTAEADVEYTEAEIANTEIRAPFDGVVGVRRVSPGAFVSSSTVIATLFSVNPIKVELDIPEKFASEVQVGMPLRFTVPGNDRWYEAKVYVLNPGINPETRTVTIRALCSNDGSLRPGSFANIELALGNNEEALMIPTQSLVPVLNGQQVFVARRDTAFPVPVQVGIRNDSAVQVTSGLAAGDTVITSGILFLRPKIKIQIKELRSAS
jgi:membrane fusion protein (multidrug efflux system)